MPAYPFRPAVWILLHSEPFKTDQGNLSIEGGHKYRVSCPGRQTQFRKVSAMTNHEARIRALAAINRVRRGDSQTLAEAAQAEGTTVASIKRLLPNALLPSRFGKSPRVTASDGYSQLVEILADEGPVQVTAHGSRERELAGRHRAACLSVLANRKPGSILRQFRNKTVGGVRLLADPGQLFKLARGGEIDGLDALYVSPGR